MRVMVVWSNGTTGDERIGIKNTESPSPRKFGLSLIHVNCLFVRIFGERGAVGRFVLLVMHCENEAARKV